ncbi:DUF6089 family protein [Hymenobacter sp. BT730]|uniref:type IX secretion system protein PorG n=1 Tax=Hymenobacter sp. BT730 TaxID=3063332 RepID=UPI0026E091FF|nr:DUF6089 family protein [Hymenobacter sp. BT730]
MINLNSHKTLLICLAQVGSVFFAFRAQAQNTSEVGLGLGVVNYKGELSPEYRFANNRPAVSAFYRKDISAPITLRGNLLAGLLRADDKQVIGVNGDTAPLNANRGGYLKGSIYEVAGILEYNFFDYYGAKTKTRFTPFVFVGVAGFLAPVKTVLQNGQTFSNTVIGVAVPAGIGAKVGLSRHWNLGMEVGARKAFTDELDQLSKQNEVLANRHDQDWYFYSGLSVSYTFYKIRCPDVYKENNRLLQ